MIESLQNCNSTIFLLLSVDDARTNLWSTRNYINGLIFFLPCGKAVYLKLIPLLDQRSWVVSHITDGYPIFFWHAALRDGHRKVFCFFLKLDLISPTITFRCSLLLFFFNLKGQQLLSRCDVLPQIPGCCDKISQSQEVGRIYAIPQAQRVNRLSVYGRETTTQIKLATYTYIRPYLASSH